MAAAFVFTVRAFCRRKIELIGYIFVYRSRGRRGEGKRRGGRRKSSKYASPETGLFGRVKGLFWPLYSSFSVWGRGSTAVPPI